MLAINSDGLLREVFSTSKIVLVYVTGDAGREGFEGTAGAKGLRGDDGGQGEDGDTGSQGIRGPKGKENFCISLLGFKLIENLFSSCQISFVKPQVLWNLK